MLTRRPSIGRIDWPSLPFHPVGKAAFPAAFLFAENVVQQISPQPLWGPLAFSVLGGIADLRLLPDRVLLLPDYARMYDFVEHRRE